LFSCCSSYQFPTSSVTLSDNSSRCNYLSSFSHFGSRKL
jgi:hypothetical protein